MSMESVMPPNHLILCLPLLLLPSSVFKMVMDREAWWAAVHRVAKDSDATEQLNYNKLFLFFLKYLFTSDSTTNVYFFTNIYFNLSFLASVIISLKDFFFLFFFFYHWVQAWPAHFPRGQWIPELRCWGKEESLIGDLEDHWLAPQNNHLIGVWMPGSFIDQRERSNVVPRSKGRLER